MHTSNGILADLLQGEIKSDKQVKDILDILDKDILDKKEVSIDFKNVRFISVYFLERFEQLINRAIDLGVDIRILNVQPNIYKVFQVARLKKILALCI
jgi:anti-anti-sigma regulatory factor